LKIQEVQDDISVTPEKHISNYRDNKKRIDDIQLDLMALRRFLAAVGIDAGTPNFLKQSSIPFPGLIAKLDKELGETNKKKDKNGGTVPGWVLWRVIFLIMGFLGFATTIFITLWHRQIAAAKKRETIAQKPDVVEEEGMQLGDFLDQVIVTKKDDNNKVA
jgi:hypothetical protein